MPAKGSKLKCGKRETINNKRFYNLFKKETNVEIEYKIFISFIEDIGEHIFEIILSDLIGFKLKNDLGFLAISKYKSNKKSINYGVFKKTGKVVLYINLHSDGYRFHLKWIKRSRFSFLKYYRFQACRVLQREINKRVRDGKNYNCVRISDYVNYGRLNSKFK